MKFRTTQKHMIDIIFPIALFFVFAFSALIVLLLAARVYQSTTENSSLSHTSQIGLSYISEKIHQNDVDGQISIGELDGQDALIITQNYDGSVYHTYIYSWKHELKELFLKENTSADLSTGTTILKINDFSMEEFDKGVFRFTCVDTCNQSDSIIVALRSE